MLFEIERKGHKPQGIHVDHINSKVACMEEKECSARSLTEICVREALLPPFTKETESHGYLDHRVSFPL